MLVLGVFHGISFVIVKLIEGLLFIKSLSYYFTKPKKCPRIEDEILFYSATQLAEKIRNRKIKSERVIEAYISRILAVNPIINAVVEDRFADAVKQAKGVDDMLKTTTLTSDELKHQYPLLGLPITIKGSIAVEGLDHGAGRVFPNGKKAIKDAHTVQLIKKAGAIVLLVSNTPEMCMTLETFNNVTGTTNNPFDDRRTPGGSSGGEAALIGAGASLMGIGSDLLGSIRVPAFYCGIYGHKPTAGAVSLDGHYPDSREKVMWNYFLTVGPLCRYAEDIPLLYKVILEKPLDLEQVHLKNLQFYIMENDGGSILTHLVENDIIQAMRRFKAHLETNYGVKVQQLNLDFSCVETMYIKVLNLSEIDTIFDKDSPSPYTELLRLIAGKSKATYMPILQGIANGIVTGLPPSIQTWADNQLEIVKKNLLEILGVNGVLIYPTHPRATHFHDDLGGRVFDFHYTAVFNGIGVPATHCPVGLNHNGLPIGFQIAAAPNNDRLTLAVAKEVELVFGGWVPPTV